MTTRDVLLIGGPADGRRIAVAAGHRTVSVVAMHPTQVRAYRDDPPSLDNVPVKRHDYVIWPLFGAETLIAYPDENGYDFHRAVAELIRGYQGTP